VFRAESFAREVRALAVTVYFGSAALLWAADSPHLAVVMVHLNVLESVLALKIKALNDSVAKAVQQLQNMQLQFALLVSSLPLHGSDVHEFLNAERMDHCLYSCMHADLVKVL